MRRKTRKYTLHEPGGYDFTPLAVESYGRQCTATHALLNRLGHLAVDVSRRGPGSKEPCVA